MKLTRIFIIIATIALQLDCYGADSGADSEGLIPSYGGSDMKISLPKPYHFLHEDARWADEAIGGSNQKIRRVGCTLCSLSMALYGLGEHTNPKELNIILKENGGYTSRGWLVWKTINKVYPNLTVDTVTQPSLKIIDDSLQSKQYPIVKFYLPGDIPHWVTIVGKDGTEYIVLDPLNLDGENYLSKLTTHIYSVRLVRKR